jgi:hypothetical protein
MMNGFLANKFSDTQFEARREEVPMPCMVDFFEKDVEPKFIIKGLNAIELNASIEANLKQKNVDNIIKAISSDKDQVESIRKTLGVSNNVPGEIAKRIETLVSGLVFPAFNHAMAVKFAETFPVEFFDITNRILHLTGMGGSHVKPPPSSP